MIGRHFNISKSTVRVAVQTAAIASETSFIDIREAAFANRASDVLAHMKMFRQSIQLFFDNIFYYVML